MLAADIIFSTSIAEAAARKVSDVLADDGLLLLAHQERFTVSPGWEPGRWGTCVVMICRLTGRRKSLSSFAVDAGQGHGSAREGGHGYLHGLFP